MVLADGATMAVRPIVPADAASIDALHKRLSAETIYFRFFSPLPTLSPAMLEHLVTVDYHDRMALVGILGDEIIAVARYERLPAPGPDGSVQAEVAFLVDDAHQGRGIGSILLEHLAAAAQEAGVTRFVADTLPNNQRMLRVFHDAGFGDEHAFSDGVVRVAFPIQATPESVETRHSRERRAAARSVERLLAPRTVAVIGPSRREASLGYILLHRILSTGFEGPVYPVHPTARHVASVRAWPTVLDVPDQVDLAVIITPSAAVSEVVSQCARKRVGGLVIVSTGFAERGPEGLAAERQLVAVARRNGMRIIGPGSMGVINTDPSVNLNATFSPAPPAGPVGFIAQSGGLGVVILDELARRGLGVSTFVSAGNKADVSGNDLLQYWDSDPATQIVGMYIETFGNPRVFARVARRVSRRKPVVAVKSGRSAAGTRAAGQPAGREQPDTAVDALFRQTGVIRTDTLDECFDVLQVLASQPHPAGNRVAIVANAGGPSVLAADACAAAGLTLAELSEGTVQALAEPLHDSQSPISNPVSLAPDALADDFRNAVSSVLADEGVDACIAISTMPLAEVAEAVGAALVEASQASPDTPLLACVLGRRELLGSPGGRRVPSFAFPEAAARALGRVTAYSAWLRRPEGTVARLDGVDRDGARRLIEAVTSGGASQWLERDAVVELLAAYGLGWVAAHEATGPENALVTAAVIQDPLFGPLVTLGAAGSRGELVGERAARTLPLTDLDAEELVGAVVDGMAVPPGRHRATGQERRSLEAVLARLASLAEDLPEVSEARLGPVILEGGEAVITGAQVRVAPWEPHPELALRRLR